MIVQGRTVSPPYNNLQFSGHNGMPLGNAKQNNKKIHLICIYDDAAAMISAFS